MIQKGLLKNESLLDFINTDDYFSEYKKNPKLKPISILEGLDFETISDDFYEKPYMDKINDFRDTFSLSVKEYPDEKIYEILKENEFNFENAFSSLFD